MELNTSYKITPSVRKQLATPIGTLFAGSIEENIPKVKEWLREQSILNPAIICVGDVVSDAFLSDNDLHSMVKMCIIDEMTRRGKFEINVDLSMFTKVQIDNPAGIISASSITVIKSHLATDSSTIIIVEGEEDLLVLPVIIFSSDNTYVVYGQPPITELESSIPAGLVMIPVNSSLRKQVEFLLKQFEKV